MPCGAWDTHFHVLGPTAKFAYSPTRKYTPPDATLQDCRAMHERLGIERGLVVHANTHGFDNAVDLDAVAQTEGRYLAVVRLDERASVAGCRALHRAGARGVRFAFNPQHGGALDLAIFDHVLRSIEGLGWFVELHFDGASLPELERWIAGIEAPVLIDHFGRIDPGPGLEQAPFAALARLAGRDHVWIKISGADRISRQGPPYVDVAPFARRLTQIAAGRLLWGSDWPHTGYFDSHRMPDIGRLLDALATLVPDESVRRMILVDNPLRLLGAHASTFPLPIATTG
jgi:predicted TIM-barrel fold metal-dependent hydrolase